MNGNMNKTRQTRGKFGEEYTARQLEQKGWRIVARNYRKRCGELDIVAIDDDNELVAVEVKTRKFGSMAYGADAVTWSKKRKIALTLLEYAAENGLESSVMRFDIAELTVTTEDPPRVIEMNYYKDAFDGTGLKLY